MEDKAKQLHEYNFKTNARLEALRVAQTLQSPRLVGIKDEKNEDILELAERIYQWLVKEL
jgi:hypothetical protein